MIVFAGASVILSGKAIGIYLLIDLSYNPNLNWLMNQKVEFAETILLLVIPTVFTIFIFIYYLKINKEYENENKTNFIRMQLEEMAKKRNTILLYEILLIVFGGASTILLVKAIGIYLLIDLSYNPNLNWLMNQKMEFAETILLLVIPAISTIFIFLNYLKINKEYENEENKFFVSTEKCDVA